MPKLKIKPAKRKAREMKIKERKPKTPKKAERITLKEALKRRGKTRKK